MKPIIAGKNAGGVPAIVTLIRELLFGFETGDAYSKKKNHKIQITTTFIDSANFKLMRTTLDNGKGNAI